MDRGIKRPNSDSGGGEASNDDEVRFWGSDHQRQAKGAKLGGAASHDRSIHAQGRNDDDSLQVATRTLECPICDGDLRQPIYQCAEGHVICSVCLPKLTRRDECPTCRSTLEGRIRNRQLEKMSVELMIHCTNRWNGCNAFLPFAEREMHERGCDFHPICRCPFSDHCRWEGALKDVLGHCATDTNAPHASSQQAASVIRLRHPNKSLQHGKVKLACPIDPAHSRTEQRFDTKLYKLELGPGDERPHTPRHLLFIRRWVESIEMHAAFVKYIGEPRDRGRFSVEISCTSPRTATEPERSLVWRGPIYQGRTKNIDICKERRCLLIPDEHVRTPGLDPCAGQQEWFQFTISVEEHQSSPALG